MTTLVTISVCDCLPDDVFLKWCTMLQDINFFAAKEEPFKLCILNPYSYITGKSFSQCHFLSDRPCNKPMRKSKYTTLHLDNACL